MKNRTALDWYLEKVSSSKVEGRGQWARKESGMAPLMPPKEENKGDGSELAKGADHLRSSMYTTHACSEYYAVTASTITTISNNRLNHDGVNPEETRPLALAFSVFSK